MTRTAIMFLAGALALLVLFAFFYVTGIAIGAVVIPVGVLAAVALVFWLMIRRKSAS